MRRAYRYKLSGNGMVMLGAVTIWLKAFDHACAAVIAVGDGRTLAVALYMAAAFGSARIGREVWRAR